MQRKISFSCYTYLLPQQSTDPLFVNIRKSKNAPLEAMFVFHINGVCSQKKRNRNGRKGEKKKGMKASRSKPNTRHFDSCSAKIKDRYNSPYFTHKAKRSTHSLTDSFFLFS